MASVRTVMIAATLGLAAQASVQAGAQAGGSAPPQKALARVAPAPAPSPGQNADELVVGPPPAWVVASAPAALREADRGAVEGGVYYALLETQTRLEPDGTHNYRRSAATVTARAGLEATGRFAASYDPTDTELIVHHVRILRDGEPPRDVLDAMTIEAARQETRLAQGIKDGTITLFGEIPGLRVGDTVDIATSLIERTPLWPGHTAGGFYMEWSVPTGLNRFRVLVPEGTRLALSTRGDAPEPVVTTDRGVTAYDWQRVHAAPRQGVSAVPLDVAEFAETTYGTWGDWNAVARWGAALYDRDLTLPDALKARLRASRRETMDARITEAIRIAQDEVRYVSDAVGLGAYTPRTPRVTWANGYGDCKDKAVLLVALLREIGVEAEPALANMQHGHALGGQAATPTAFDHVIVRIRRGRRTVFVDATSTLQGGVFPNLAPPNYGYVLPLTKKGQLEKIAVAQPQDRQLDVVETFDLGGLTGDATLRVTTTRTGGLADAFRMQSDSQSTASISESYLSFYRELYPGIEETAEVVIEDDRDANRTVVTERYRVPAEAMEAMRLEFNIYPSGAMIGLPSRPKADRTLPIALPYPVKARHRVTLLNAGLPFDEEAPIRREVGPLRYAVTTKAAGRDLTVTYEIETRGDRIEPGDLSAYAEAQTLWDRESSTVWTLPRDRKEAMRLAR